MTYDEAAQLAEAANHLNYLVEGLSAMPEVRVHLWRAVSRAYDFAVGAYRMLNDTRYLAYENLSAAARNRAEHEQARGKS